MTTERMTPHAALVAAVRAYLDGWNERAGMYLDDCPCLELMAARRAMNAALSSAEAARGEEYTEAAVDLAEAYFCWASATFGCQRSHTIGALDQAERRFGSARKARAAKEGE